jgi:competence protein ComEC
MNEIIFSIQKFPLAIVDKLSFSLIAILLFYPALIHIVFTIQHRKLRGFFAPLSILMLLSGLYAFSTIEHIKQKRIVIYHLYKNSLIDFMDGTTCFSFTKKENMLAYTQPALKYASDNHRIQLQINKIRIYDFRDALKTPFLTYNDGLCQFGSYRLAILDDLPLTPILLPLDAVVIRNNPRLKIEDLYQKVQTKLIIFDASNSRYHVDKWKSVCINLKIPFYDIAQSGAWEINF